MGWGVGKCSEFVSATVRHVVDEVVGGAPPVVGFRIEGAAREVAQRRETADVEAARQRRLHRGVDCGQTGAGVAAVGQSARRQRVILFHRLTVAAPRRVEHDEHRVVASHERVKVVVLRRRRDSIHHFRFSLSYENFDHQILVSNFANEQLMNAK